MTTPNKADAAFTYKVVDADAHLNPPATFWSDYLPERLREKAPRIEHGTEEEGVDWVVFEGKRKKLNLSAAQAGRANKDFKWEGRFSDIRAGNFEAQARIKDMDMDGIDAAVLYGGGPLGTLDMDLYIESFRAYNRYLKDFCSFAPHRLCGVAYLPMRDIDESLAMLKDVAAMGYTAVNIPGFPQSRTQTVTNGQTGASSSMGAQAAALTGDPWGDRQYDDPEFDRFWAAVVDLDITVTVHLGGRIVRFDNKKRFLGDMLMSKFAMAEPIAILIYGGVFDRHPGLRFATIESGAGWLAFAADYMDRTWEKQRYWTNSALEKPPSFYLDRNVYASFIHDQIAIATRDMPGAGNIMWSSDYPHSETLFPHSMEWIDRLFKDVPEEQKREITCGRARGLFRIGE